MSIGISFKLAPHTSRAGVEIIEIWMDGHFVGTLTPNDTQDGVKLISRHMDTCWSDTHPLGDMVHVDFKVKA
jgi:hypothetical protein